MNTDDKSTLVQVMAWCRQATSHYLNQCRPRSPTPYGVTGPQWVNSLFFGKVACIFKIVYVYVTFLRVIASVLPLEVHLDLFQRIFLVISQVMAWCHWAPSLYPIQCWPRSEMHMVLQGHNQIRNSSFSTDVQFYMVRKMCATETQFDQMTQKIKVGAHFPPF